MIKTITSILGTLAASAALTSTASAQIVLNSSDMGWYDSTGNHDTANHNYFTGQLGGTEFHSFFNFDLSSVSGSVLSAELRIFNPLDSFYSSDASESLTIFDVSTSSASLLGGTAGVAGFGDLGSGFSLGSATLTPASNGTYTTINLNGFGLTFLQAALGNEITFGGAINLSSSDDQGVFAFTDLDYVAGNVQLALRLDDGQITPVPEPSTYGLIGAAGLIGLVIVRRRRNAAK